METEWFSRFLRSDSDDAILFVFTNPIIDYWIHMIKQHQKENSEEYYKFNRYAYIIFESSDDGSMIADTTQIVDE